MLVAVIVVLYDCATSLFAIGPGIATPGPALEEEAPEPVLTRG